MSDKVILTMDWVTPDGKRFSEKREAELWCNALESMQKLPPDIQFLIGALHAKLKELSHIEVVEEYLRHRAAYLMHKEEMNSRTEAARNGQ